MAQSPWEATVMAGQRERWQVEVGELVRQVAEWADPEEWVTKRYPKRMRDADGTVFEVPSLVLQKGPTRLLLDPIGYDAPGSDGVVDLYLMPIYDDASTLTLAEGRWRIHHVFHDQPADSKPRVLDLDEGTINRVLDEIAAHAVPSV